MQNLMRQIIFSLALLPLSIASTMAATEVTVGNSLSSFQGNYGTNNNIQIVYDETYFQYKDGDTTFKLSVPYLSIKNLPAGAIVSAGAITNGNAKQTKNVNGLGDVWLESGYAFQPISNITPTMYGKIKFATASQSAGLGTGKEDYEGGVEFQQVHDSMLFTFASLGYRKVDKPSNYALQNLWTYKAGVSYADVSPVNFLTAMLSGTSAQQAGLTAPVDFILAWNYNTTIKGSGFQIFLDKGLTKSTSNFGIGIAAQSVF